MVSAITSADPLFTSSSLMSHTLVKPPLTNTESKAQAACLWCHELRDFENSLFQGFHDSLQCTYRFP